VSAKPEPRTWSGFHPNVVALGLTSFFTDVSTEMLIEGVAEFTASSLRLVAGRLSDRIGKRKPFLVAGYGLSTVCKTLMAFARSWPMMLRVPLR